MAAITLPTAGLLNAGPGVLQCAMLLIGGDDQGSAVDVEFDAQETLAVCNVPANCFIDHVSCVTETAWTTSVTLDLGDGDDADGFLASAKVAPTTAVTTGILKSSVRARAEAYGVGKLYAAADTLDVVIGGATPAVGKTRIFIFYIPDYSALPPVV